MNPSGGHAENSKVLNVPTNRANTGNISTVRLHKTNWLRNFSSSLALCVQFFIYFFIHIFLLRSSGFNLSAALCEVFLIFCSDGYVCHKEAVAASHISMGQPLYFHLHHIISCYIVWTSTQRCLLSYFSLSLCAPPPPSICSSHNDNIDNCATFMWDLPFHTTDC